MNKKRWKAVKALKVPPPRMLHVASEPLVLPAVDSQALASAINRGEVCDIQYQTLANGTLRRVARTKGATYRRYPIGMLRVTRRRLRPWNPRADDLLSAAA